MIRHTGRVLSASAALLLTTAAGCGLRRQAAVGFAPTPYVVFGRVTRAARAWSGAPVKLYDATAGAQLDSLAADGTGYYGFDRAPAGGVMVKVSSTDTLDFAYVRYILVRGTATERDSVPPFETRTGGCAPLAPAAGAGVPTPSPAAPLTFAWSPVGGNTGARYKARLADARDSTVWESTRDFATSAAFNGIGSAGAYAGALVPPGAYQWRVKVKFPDGVQAATREQALTFSAAGARP